MATVRFLDQLETEHQVYRQAQSRSNGHERFSYMLSLGRGEEPGPVVAEDVESILRQRGKGLGEKDETLLVIIGKYGYPTHGLYGKLNRGEACLEPLLGRCTSFLRLLKE